MQTTHTELLSLPWDILLLIEASLASLQDCLNLRSTCRTIYACTKQLSPKIVLSLAIQPSNTLCGPDRLLIAAMMAPKVGHWARLCQENEDQLALALRDSYLGLLDLSIDLHDLHLNDFLSTYRETSALVRKAVNVLQDSKFCKDRGSAVQDPRETHKQSLWPSLLYMAVYGGIFGPDSLAFIHAQGTRRLSNETRTLFARHCLADMSLERRITIRPACSMFKQDDHNRSQLLSRSITFTGKLIRDDSWRSGWKSMLNLARQRQNYPYASLFENEAGWRARLLRAVLISQGLATIAMIVPESQDVWLTRVMIWQAAVAKLDSAPVSSIHGTAALYPCPSFRADMIWASRAQTRRQRGRHRGNPVHPAPLCGHLEGFPECPG